MRITFNLFLLAPLFFWCSLKNNADPIEIIDFRTRAEFFSKEREMVSIDKQVRIVSLNDKRLYIAPHIHTKREKTLDASGKIIGSNVISRDTSFMVYAWVVGDKFGLKYSLADFKSDKGSIVSVDSMMTVFGITTESFKFFNVDLAKPDTVISNGLLRLEKYSLNKTHFSGVDSIYKYYDKNMRDINFSFSEKSDKENDSKLVKISFIHNMIPKDVFLSDMDVPRREDFYAITRGSNKDLNIYKELFSKLDKKRKTVN